MNTLKKIGALAFIAAFRVKETSRRNCYAFYDVTMPNGQVVPIQAWVIVGGQLAVAFMDYSFQQRYGKEKGYKANNYCSPEISSFKNGEKDLYNFVRKNLPKLELRDKRLATLREYFPTLRVRSPRFHDTFQRVYFRANLDLHYISPVSIDSAIFGGRCTNELEQYGNIAWRSLGAHFNPLFDGSTSRNGWEALTEKQFSDCLTMLKTFSK